MSNLVGPIVAGLLFVNRFLYCRPCSTAGFCKWFVCNTFSTRAQDKNGAKRSFSQILLEGLAPDGGLYMPDAYPSVTKAELDSWRSLSYAGLAFEILKKFADDIPEADLKALVEKTYTSEVYKNVRSGDSKDAITPLRLLEEKDGQDAHAAWTLEWPDSGIQGYGDADARQSFRIRIDPQKCRTEYSGCDFRRYRQCCRICHERQEGHPGVHAVAAPENERFPDGTDVQPARPEHFQHRYRRGIQTIVRIS